MATPLGHGLVGAGCYTAVRGKRWRLVEAAICGFLAAMPDLDMIYSAAVSGKVGTFHRGFTHRPAFALIVSSAHFAAGTILNRGVTAGLLLWSVFAGFLVATHQLMDTRVRLPYRHHEWDGESSLSKVLSSQTRRVDISNYLILSVREEEGC